MNRHFHNVLFAINYFSPWVCKKQLLAGGDNDEVFKVKGMYGDHISPLDYLCYDTLS